MKNYAQAGETITLIALAIIVSGDGILAGSLFGIASNSAAIGQPVEAKTTGVFAIPAVTADVGPVGTKVYWDNTAKKVTTVATGNSLIGALTVAKISTDTVATVRLNGITV